MSSGCIYNYGMARNDRQTARRCAEEIASDCVGARARMLSRGMTRAYDEALRPLGIKLSQMNILVYVILNGPIQPSEVANALSLEKSTLSRNVRILEANGWLETLPGTSARTQTLQVTSRGAALVAKATPRWRSVQNELVGILGKRTASDMIKAARRLRDRELQ